MRPNGVARFRARADDIVKHGPHLAVLYFVTWTTMKVEKLSREWKCYVGNVNPETNVLLRWWDTTWRRIGQRKSLSDTGKCLGAKAHSASANPRCPEPCARHYPWRFTRYLSATSWNAPPQTYLIPCCGKRRCWNDYAMCPVQRNIGTVEIDYTFAYQKWNCLACFILWQFAHLTSHFEISSCIDFIDMPLITILATLYFLFPDTWSNSSTIMLVCPQSTHGCDDR